MPSSSSSSESESESESESGSTTSDGSSDCSRSPKKSVPRIVPLNEIPDYSTGKIPQFKGAKGPFEPKQKAIILAVYAPRYLAMRAQKPRPRKRARSKWLKTAIAEILESDLFKNLDPKFTKDQWAEVVLLALRMFD